MVTVTLMVADVLDALRRMASESVDCVITSPPYWALRDYEFDGQIGMEADLDAHLEIMVRIFEEIRRVLKPHGTLWINYGDAYASTVNGRSAKDTKAAGSDNRTYRDKPLSTVGGVFKPKDLLMIPNRLAIALQEAGWWVRSEIIWAKPNAMPSSVADRPGLAHEKIFLLTKSERYFYDQTAVRLPEPEGRRADPTKSMFCRTDSPRGGGLVPGRGGTHRADREPVNYYGKGRGLRTVEPDLNALVPPDLALPEPFQVWTIPTKGFPGAHFATFPKELVVPMVLAGTSGGGNCSACGTPWRRIVQKEFVPQEQQNPDCGIRQASGLDPSVRWAGSTRGSVSVETLGWEPSCSCVGAHAEPPVVLDPFGGAGTVGLVAAKLERSAILIEAKPEYADMARNRLMAARVSVEIDGHLPIAPLDDGLFAEAAVQ